MSGERWTVAGERNSYGNPEHLLWPDDQDHDIPHRFTASHMGEAWPNTEDTIVDAAFAALITDVRDAARLRSLAHHFDLFDNRGRSFTGAEVAAMLRDGEHADDSDNMPGSEFDGPVIL